MSALIERYRRVRDEVATKSGGKTALIAVSKTHPFATIEELYREGQRDFGENYVQEMVEKAEAAKLAGLSEIRWHFIGHLQSNKVKNVLPYAYLIHTLDRKSLFDELVKRAEGREIKILLEVNIDREESKSGLLPEEVAAFVANVPADSPVKLAGWMAIPKPSAESEARAAFRALKVLGTAHPRVGSTLSIGMSADYTAAIEEGSSYVRVGTAIFGQR